MQPSRDGKSNMLSAGGSMQNFNFDFNLGSIAGGKPIGAVRGGASLKDQKAQGSGTASGTAKPWTPSTAGAATGATGSRPDTGTFPSVSYSGGSPWTAGPSPASRPPVDTVRASGLVSSATSQGHAFASLWSSASSAAKAPKPSQTPSRSSVSSAQGPTASSHAPSYDFTPKTSTPVRSAAPDDFLSAFASMGRPASGSGSSTASSAPFAPPLKQPSAPASSFPLQPPPGAKPVPPPPSFAPQVQQDDPFSSFSQPSADPFGFPAPQSAFPPPPASAADPFSSSTGSFDAFASAFPSTAPPAASAATRPSVDPLEALLFGAGKAAPAAAKAGGGGSFPGSTTAANATAGDDWGVFGGGGASSSSSSIPAHVAAEATVELEGLPPPPAGVSFAAALAQGKDFASGGQFADAIKWLLWAEALSGSGEGSETEVVAVFQTRAKCYKEAGEMKKAVADCSKVLSLDPQNCTVLMQRALLYESLEKYKAGADDLRKLTRLEPSNRQAASLLARLNKAAAAMG